MQVQLTKESTVSKTERRTPQVACDRSGMAGQTLLYGLLEEASGVKSEHPKVQLQLKKSDAS